MAGAKGADFVWVSFGNIYFDTNEATLTPAAQKEIERIVAYMQANPTFKLELEGFADPRGSYRDNMKLSSRRAQAVQSAIVAAGIPKDRIVLTAFGELSPKCDQANEACWQQSRRVEAVVLPALPGEATTASAGASPAIGAASPATK